MGFFHVPSFLHDGGQKIDIWFFIYRGRTAVLYYFILKVMKVLTLVLNSIPLYWSSQLNIGFHWGANSYYTWCIFCVHIYVCFYLVKLQAYARETKYTGVKAKSDITIKTPLFTITLQPLRLNCYFQLLFPTCNWNLVKSGPTSFPI